MARKTPEFSASSMADIAFLLLIFFLVSTTMNVDTGLSRTLPPLVDNPDDQGIKVRKRNVLSIKVAGNDMILAGGKRVDISEVKDIAIEFALPNIVDNPDKPEFELVDIEGIGNGIAVSKGLISLQNDNSTSYSAYLAVQNELTKAYNEMRNDRANSVFGKNYEDLDADQQKAIRTAVPTKISEAEPVGLIGDK